MLKIPYKAEKINLTVLKEVKTQTQFIPNNDDNSVYFHKLDYISQCVIRICVKECK